jgi:hypothetical protein
LRTVRFAAESDHTTVYGFYILFFLIAGFVATLAMLVALMARC